MKIRRIKLNICQINLALWGAAREPSFSFFLHAISSLLPAFFRANHRPQLTVPSPPAPHLKPTPSPSPAARLISFLSFTFAKQQHQRSSRAVGWRSLSSPELQLPGDFRRCKLVVRDSILHLSLQFLDLGLISWFPILGFLMQFVQFSFNWV